MGLKDSALFQGQVHEGGFGQWHANLIHINRRKCVLFANDITLFNFIAPDVSRSQIRELEKLFLSYLHPVLADEGFTEKERRAIAEEYEGLQFDRTNSKSVLGSLHDLALHYEHRIMASGGTHSHQIPSIISELNPMPMGALNYAYPIEELRKFV